MMLPTIHMNGTAKVELHDAYVKAHRALSDALILLSWTSPNGRDYYPQPLGADAIVVAAREHKARMDALKKVLTELEDLAVHTL